MQPKAASIKENNNTWQSIGFSQREYDGFRGCREYDKKRIIFTSEKSIAIYHYEPIKPDKVYKLTEWMVNDESLVITSADFFEDLRPNVILMTLFNPTNNNTTVKLLKLRSNKGGNSSYLNTS